MLGFLLVQGTLIYETVHPSLVDVLANKSFAQKVIAPGQFPIQKTYKPLTTHDKRVIGFLYLRTLRTGRRALSLERGSLLDIVLRIRDIRPQMWEDVIGQLHSVKVAAEPSLGLSDILSLIQEKIRKLVPIECADAPTLRVSSLTREHLRQVLTVFMGTGATDKNGNEHLAPYTRQGTGTINTLVLALLSMIAEIRQNVIFAMEEPEISIPPHTQKRLVNSVIAMSSQAIFTSHSPYVLEEFVPADILLLNRRSDELTGVPLELPPAVKNKTFKDEVKRRFCEAILSRRVLIVEGNTEFEAIRSLTRRLEELEPERYVSFDGLGIAVVNFRNSDRQRQSKRDVS